MLGPGRDRNARWAAFLAGALASPQAFAGAALTDHDDVGPSVVEVSSAELRPAGGAWRAVAWDDLEGLHLTPGHYELRVTFDVGGDGQAVVLPPCAGSKGVTLDGRAVGGHPDGAPVVAAVTPGPHVAIQTIAVGKYEGRVACGLRPRIGPGVRSVEGLGTLDFDSPHAAAGGGRAVVFVPPGHALDQPAALLVGAHPWNGSMWTYAAYGSLLREAARRDVVLLMPSGLGNSLYTADAEDEVLRAIDALSARMAIDRRRVSIWGASMGGAGATTIGFHHPDRFAGVTSFFGDSRYDLATYVRPILVDERGAHLVNALDVLDNARSLPVWLVHGEEDRTSPIRQSAMLASALEQRGFTVRFDRVPGVGHSGALVARMLPELVARAAAARVPDVTRVSYRSVAARQLGAYGVRIVRASPGGDAFVDVEHRPDGVHVTSAEGVAAIELAPGALGVAPDGPRPHVSIDCVAPGLKVVWGSPP
jgi:enterochelin esterase-like enzyme